MGKSCKRIPSKAPEQGQSKEKEAETCPGQGEPKSNIMENPLSKALGQGKDRSEELEFVVDQGSKRAEHKFDEHPIFAIPPPFPQ